MHPNTGILYLCPTPIGNLEDITLRALKTLKEADYIAAEDTRVTRKLLNHYEIKTPVLSYHEHNKNERGPKIISLLQEGKSVALVTDAGTPGISDPGEDLVRLAVEAGVRVVPLPGPAAAVCALVASGLSTERFAFEGFLPRKTKERKQRLLELADERRTMVLYEAPHRVIKTLNAMREALGNRRIAVAREMTKIHEEFFRGTIDQALERFEKDPPRGEMVLVVEGRGFDGMEKGGEGPTKFRDGLVKNGPEDPARQHGAASGGDVAELDTAGLRSLLELKMEEHAAIGIGRKQALKIAARELGIARNDAYRILIEDKSDHQKRY
jgi:16S rRNA (cytidine1402-2'-O)-methyltransferase